MKVIFLDIDGVLNSHRYMKTGKFRKGASFHDVNVSMIDPKTIKHLNSITDATGAKIVLSSSWRIYRLPTKKACQTLFDAVGIKGECIGLTSCRPDEIRKTINEYTTRGWMDRVFRGHEIHAWLLEHDSEANWGTPEDIESFIILDDGSDMEYLTHRLVNTSWEVGLTKADAKKAIELLNEPPSSR